MGWWSTDIMGGHTPLDMEIIIYQALDLEMDSPLPKEIDLEPMLKKVKNDDEYWLGEGANIFYQVLGVMMMKYGCTIPDHLKKQMIESAKNDEWAKEDGADKRKDVMNNFIKALKSYDGTPIKITSKGLFEVMAEKLSPLPSKSEDTELSKDDLFFIQGALNEYFLSALSKLGQKDKLGDIAYKQYEEQRDRSMKLIKKIDKLLVK